MSAGLPELLRQRRDAFGLSLSQAAKGVPMTKSHLWELESGRSANPSIFILYGLSRELHLHPHDLIDACFATIKASLRDGDPDETGAK